MDINDNNPEPLTYGGDFQPRRDPRKVIACFAVSALAAVAVFLVSSGDEPATSPQVVPTTAAPRPDAEPAPEAKPSDRAEAPEVGGESEGGFFDDLFGDRLDDGLVGSREPAPEGPANEDSLPDSAGDSDVFTVAGRDFTIDVPSGWTSSTVGDTVEVSSADRSAGVGVTLAELTPGKDALEQQARDWEGAARQYLMADLEILERSPVTIGGLEGFGVRYEGSVSGERLLGEVWWLVQDDVVWVVSSASTPGDTRTVAAVARSFRPTARS